jgi:hypothetical protein
MLYNAITGSQKAILTINTRRLAKTFERGWTPMGYISVIDVMVVAFAAMMFVVALVGLMIHIADKFSKRK